MLRKGVRLRVAVLMGGPSSEHDVSLQGGRNVVESLDANLFEVRPVVITREGRWRLAPKGVAMRASGKAARGKSAFSFNPHENDGWPEYDNTLEALLQLKRWRVDCAMPVLHGRFGEDGVLQACLAAAGIPFVGSGSRASALANDKIRTKEVLSFHGIATPRFEVLLPEDLRRGRAMTAERLAASFGLPLVVKDPRGGSSLEVRVCDDLGQVAAALDELGRAADRLLVEAFVKGRELTGGVLEDRERGTPVALPLVEIRPRRGRTFDYFEKYDENGAEELVPAPVPPEVERDGRALALRVHALLGLRGISRTDFMLDDAQRLQVLEVNTLPGMTSRGLVPKAAASAGITFPVLLGNLVRSASLE